MIGRDGNRGRAVMPLSRYSGVFEPADLELLQSVFDQLCKRRGLTREDSEQREELAEEVVRTFRGGIGDEASLLLAISKNRSRT
jgi:hypothetical protein